MQGMELWRKKQSVEKDNPYDIHAGLLLRA